MTQQIKLEKIRVERRGGVAVWKQIAEEIRSELAKKGAKTGARMPTEAEMSQVFDVNRHTVRRAISQLIDEGVLRADQGRGTFVAKAPMLYPIGPQTRFTDNLSGQAQKLKHTFHNIREVEATTGLAAQFDVEAGSILYQVEGLAYADDQPVIIGTSWFLKEMFPDLPKELTQLKSVTKLLAKHGQPDYQRKETRISADIANAEQARTLGIDEGDPLIVMYSLNVSSSGVPLEVGRGFVVADRIHLTVQS